MLSFFVGKRGDNDKTNLDSLIHTTKELFVNWKVRTKSRYACGCRPSRLRLCRTLREWPIFTKICSRAKCLTFLGPVLLLFLLTFFCLDLTPKLIRGIWFWPLIHTGSWLLSASSITRAWRFYRRFYDGVTIFVPTRFMTRPWLFYWRPENESVLPRILVNNGHSLITPKARKQF